MTCIVGLVHDGRVYLGGDAASVGGWTLNRAAEPKVFNLRNEFVIGYTSSFRMGQLLRYKFEPPVHYDGEDLRKYLVVDFVDALRGLLKDGGYATKEKDAESGGVFLVGYRGRLFYVGEDYQISEPAEGYLAVGSGDTVALGALYAVHRNPNMDPVAKLQMALLAAEAHNIGVHGPYTVAVDRV